MSTISCTKKEFNNAWCEFNQVQGQTASTQQQVSLAHKCLVLHYVGLKGTDKEIEEAAMFLKIATSGALRRGWTLDDVNIESE